MTTTNDPRDHHPDCTDPARPCAIPDHCDGAYRGNAPACNDCCCIPIPDGSPDADASCTGCAGAPCACHDPEDPDAPACDLCERDAQQLDAPLAPRSVRISMFGGGNHHYAPSALHDDSCEWMHIDYLAPSFTACGCGAVVDWRCACIPCIQRRNN